MTALRDLMEPIGPTVTTDMDQEDALKILQRFGLHALPVLDNDGRLVGVTTSDDLLDIAQQEGYRGTCTVLVGLVDDEALTAPVTTALRRRLPWLLLNLATAFAAAAVVAAFESTLARVAALGDLPADHRRTGGQCRHAGSPRLPSGRWRWANSIATSHGWYCPAKRSSGSSPGSRFGLLVGIVGWVWQDNPWLGVAVGAAMLGTMVVAGLFGLLIPIILRGLGADPALAASIFVTTATDMLGFSVFSLGSRLCSFNESPDRVDVRARRSVIL